jgi:adenylate cyclase
MPSDVPSDLPADLTADRLASAKPLSNPAEAWLLKQEPSRVDAEGLVAGLCGELNAAGIPIWRSATSLLTLHPEVYVRNIAWTRGTGSRSAYRLHDVTHSPDYLDSPVAALHRGESQVRSRLEQGEVRYATLGELKSQGATDYVAFALVYSDKRRSYVSFATDRAGGFSDDEVATLQGLLPVLALRLELESAYYATRCLLEVYLGKNAATHVLGGAFRRGGGASMDAAIFTCDLRGFTALSDRLPVRTMVSLLDRYFETVAAPIARHEGEVLKFVGDAVLAVFPFRADGAQGGDRADACRRALEAAEDALDAMRGLTVPSDGAAVSLGIGLHEGEVLYGNVGAAGRLDFTVIGPAVNEVCRIESLCKDLGVPLLMSARFAAACPQARVVSLGQHQLKGVAQPQEVCTLARLAPVR